MDAIGYFIGHDSRISGGRRRALQAVVGAHIIHMLRDTADDLAAGYFNVPRSVLEAHHLAPSDVHHPAYRRWVRDRIASRPPMLRGWQGLHAPRRLPAGLLAGLLYCARFEVVLQPHRAGRLPAAVRYDYLPPLAPWLTRFVRGIGPPARSPAHTRPAAPARPQSRQS